MLHHRDSVLSADYDARAAVFRAALREVDPVRCGRKVFEMHGKSPPPPGLAEAEGRFRATVEKSRARLRDGPAHAEARRTLAARLDAVLREAGDPRLAADVPFERPPFTDVERRGRK